MKLTARQLNRATLGRQMLLRRESMPVVDAVHHIVALQAQEPASPYLALWNRLTDFDPGDLDRAFSDHAIVKATLMRIAMHAVEATDYPAFHEAMQRTLRAARLNDRRFTSTGLTSADADDLIPEVAAFAEEAVAGILLLFTLALTWMAVIPGLTAKSADGASAFSYPLVFLPFISSAFVPTDTMPGPVRTFAENQPVTSIVNAIRDLFTQQPVGTDIWIALAWCVGILIVAYTFAMRTYRRKIS